VTGFGGADEIVIGTAERCHHVFEQLRHLLDEFGGAAALLAGRLLDLLAVFIGAGQEQDVIAVEPFEAGKRIRCQHFIGMADMGSAIRIRNGGGDIELLFHLRILD
jgi:hypothetical protein